MEAPPHTDLRLRRAALSDVPALRRLIEISIRGIASRTYDARQVESSLRYVFGVDSQLIKDGTYFVADSRGRLVGAGGWSRRRTHYGGDDHLEFRDEGLRDPTQGDPAVIRAFYVHPDWTRQGIGRRLMEASEAAARQEGFTRFELIATLTGVPLYEAFGYRRLEPKQLRLPDGVVMDGFHMGKP